MHGDNLSLDERRIGQEIVAGQGATRLYSDVNALALLGLVQERLAGAPVTPPRFQAGIGGRGLAAVAAIVIVVALSAGLVTGAFHSAPHVRFVPMSWANAFGSVPEIGAASDLVVVGRVERATSVQQTDVMPETTFTVAVERVLKGSSTASILVLQEGGPEGPSEWVEAEEFPLMEPGEHVLLFLREISGDETLWAIVGGPQGRLIVTGDHVATTPTEFVLPIPDDFKVDDVASLLGTE